MDAERFVSVLFELSVGPELNYFSIDRHSHEPTRNDTACRVRIHFRLAFNQLD